MSFGMTNAFLHQPDFIKTYNVGPYMQLLPDRGFGNVSFFRSVFGLQDQVSIVFGASDKYVFTTASSCSSYQESLNRTSGLLRSMCSAKFGIVEDVPDVMALPEMFDFPSLLIKLAKKYNLHYKVSVVKLSRHLTTIEFGDFKCCSSGDEYRSASVAGRNVLATYFAKVRQPLSIVFEKEWFFSLDAKQTEMYDWFFNYSVPDPEIVGDFSTQTLQENEVNVITSFDAKLVIKTPGMAVISVWNGNDRMLRKVSLGETTIVGKEMHLRRSYGEKYVISIVLNSQLFVWEFINMVKEGTQTLLPPVSNMYQLCVKRDSEKRIAPVEHKRSLEMFAEYVTAADTSTFPLISAVIDLYIVGAGGLSEAGMNRYCSALYVMLYATCKSVCGVPTVKYSYLKRFLEIFGGRGWCQTFDDIYKGGWFVSPVLGNFVGHTIALIPCLHTHRADFEYVNTYTGVRRDYEYRRDAKVMRPTRGEKTGLVCGTGMRLDAVTPDAVFDFVVADYSMEYSDMEERAAIRSFIASPQCTKGIVKASIAKLSFKIMNSMPNCSPADTIINKQPLKRKRETLDGEFRLISFHGLPIGRLKCVASQSDCQTTKKKIPDKYVLKHDHKEVYWEFEDRAGKAQISMKGYSMFAGDGIITLENTKYSLFEIEFQDNKVLLKHEGKYAVALPDGTILLSPIVSDWSLFTMDRWTGRNDVFDNVGVDVPKIDLND